MRLGWLELTLFIGSSDDMAKSAAYSSAKYRFGRWRASAGTLAGIGFIGFGGLGIVEDCALYLSYAIDGGKIMTGLFFFVILLLLTQLLNIPFSLYNSFVIEEKFGFNRQTKKGFATDLLKGLGLAALLGGPLLAGILWIMDRTGDNWWLWAWGVVSSFSILTAWLYPTFLAPLFNKFTPLEEGELRSEINQLAAKIGFASDGIFVMDASKRSAHGNAYFTGVFGKKRIVLFDTLLADMSAKEVTAVLAHELGHFKLHHVRNGMLRGLLMSLGVFYLMSLVVHHSVFYDAFKLSDISNYAGLVIFALWFGIVEFLLQPFDTWLSRSNEFAADNFAKSTLNGAKDMVGALKKLREKSFVMPLSHPLFSKVYHSHPPLLERIRALKQ
ncbi:MAG: M48 family metallopeptidase [Proteobacteria bacterium]|nr:M48 family metallopeptidase [Pseudomonadota bacterium]